jgi:monofunctional biosynthetic peptidoglycan transglycosylase
MDLLRRTGRWMRAHKVKAVLLILAAWLLVEVLTVPFLGISRLAKENPGVTALMEQRREEAEDAGKSPAMVQRWIPLGRIPRHVINAVVVAEDGTFFDHGGIDWFEVQESFERNVRERRAARGASTITQQVAKNLYLSTAKTPLRKAKEVLITLLLERSLTKNRILEIYLNIIEWGRGVYGIDAAARLYFGKSAAGLTLDEGARLAAVIPSPLRHRPDENSRYVLRRRNIILARMHARRQTTSPTTEEAPSSPTPELSSPPPDDERQPDVVPDTIDSDEEDPNDL